MTDIQNDKQALDSLGSSEVTGDTRVSSIKDITNNYVNILKYLLQDRINVSSGNSQFRLS